MLGRIDNEILKLAGPNIISNISVPLLSTVDVILMGSISIEHLAAIGIGGMLFNLIYWNLGFLRMGTTGMIAQAYGRSDTKAIADILSRAVLVALVLAIVIVICKGILFDFGLYFFGLEGATEVLTKQYFDMRIWAAPATLLIYVLTGWLFGMQNAWAPLFVTVAVNVINILVSYGLVKIADMGMTGVAMGTVIAQYGGVGILVGILWYRYSEILELDWYRVLSNPMALLGFLRLNADIFLRTLCLTLVFASFYSLSMALGTVVLAVNVILQQFVNWMSYIIDGFAYAAESLVGKYKGANVQSDLEQVVRKCLVWGGVGAVLFSISFILFDHQLVKLFSDDPVAIAASKPLLVYVWVFPVIAFGSYLWDGIFIGLLATKSMRNSMVMSLGLFLLTLWILPEYENGEHIWMALSVFVIARGLIQSWMYNRSGTALS